MDKKKITAIVIFAVVAVVIVLIGLLGSKLLNNDTLKDYSTDDLTFQSTETLNKKTVSGYGVYFENYAGDVIVLGNKENKADLAKLGYEDLNLEKYATVIYEGEDDTISELKQSDDKKFYYFTYDYKEGSEDIFYVGAMYETENDFWLINFACKLSEQKKYEEKFIEWASTQGSP